MTVGVVISVFLKALVAYVVFKVCKLVYSHLALKRRLTSLEKQGVTIYPGASSLMGNLAKFGEYCKKMEESEVPLKTTGT